jgi:dipeptidyl-peptidase-4
MTYRGPQQKSAILSAITLESTGVDFPPLCVEIPTMQRRAILLSIGASLLFAAACTPASDPGPGAALPHGVSAAPAGPASPADSAPDRVKIAGAEASRITFEHLARFPPLGPSPPFLVQFSPDGKLITYLQKESKEGRIVLFGFDVAAKSARLLARGEDFAKDSKPMDRAEELRRERQRKFIQGVTGYQWAKRAPVMLIPYAGDIFLRAEDGKITRLTETPDAELDPKICDGGERVAFVRNSELFVMDVATRRETQLTKGATEGVTHGLSDFNGQEEFGESSGFWLSPGCDRIAYLEVDERHVETLPVLGYRNGKADFMMQRYPLTGQKNPKVTAGIMDLATKKTAWLSFPDNAERYLGRFVWSPDGKALWLQALSRDQKRLSLLRADSVSGKTTELFSETSPTWVEFTEMKLLEQSSSKFVWKKAIDGHAHVELRDARSGAAIAPLTAGDWDVTGIAAVDEERGRLLFTATKDGPLDRHLYSVLLAGGRPIQKLTAEPGVHFISAERQGRAFVDLHSAAGRMWKAAAHGADWSALGDLPVPVDAELSGLDLRTPEFVQIKGPSGDTLHGSLLKPRHIDPNRRYPVLVMIYGGPYSQAVLNLWSQKLLWNHLADRNIVVFELDNRGTVGRGRKFEEALYGNLGHIELIDQIAGLDYLKTLPFVDSNRVGIYGHSYGGSMVLHAMLRAPDRFHVGISASPVTDQRLYDTGYTERYMGTPESNPKGYESADLTKLAPNLRGKLLLLHGMMDENVHFENTAKMIDAFIAANKPFDMLIFPGERHGYNAPATKQYAMRRIVDYLAENL